MEENVNFYIVEIDGSRKKTDQKEYNLPCKSIGKEVKVSWKISEAMVPKNHYS